MNKTKSEINGKEYEKIIDQAWEECEKTTDHAEKEYEKIKEQAAKEYIEIRKQAVKKYIKIKDQAKKRLCKNYRFCIWEKYWKIRVPAWEKCKKRDESE